MANKNQSGGGVGQLAMVGAGIAALAAGYYFLGPKGKKHQKHAKAWAIKMKADVIEKLETMQDVTEEKYHEVVDGVSEIYKRDMKAGHEEVQELAKDLKKHWKTISGAMKGPNKTKKASKKAK